jgi:hypothetical protein
MDQQAEQKAATFQIKNSSAGPSLRRSHAPIVSKTQSHVHVKHEKKISAIAEYFSVKTSRPSKGKASSD